jgi:hypothetical protein
VRATSDWEEPASTAVITRRRFDELEEFDMTKPVETSHADDLRHAIPMSRDTPFRCPEPAHCPRYEFQARIPSGSEPESI